jgi:phosphoribosylformylglycinamidine synthase subunit PurS
VRFEAQLVVSLKEGLLDPQGKAVESALPALGWDNVDHVRVGKYIQLAIEVSDRHAAEAQVRSLAERFLSNQVIEDFRLVSLTEAGALTSGDRP